MEIWDFVLSRPPFPGVPNGTATISCIMIAYRAELGSTGDYAPQFFFTKKGVRIRLIRNSYANSGVAFIGP
jgi:hypothetical protein